MMQDLKINGMDIDPNFAIATGVEVVANRVFNSIIADTGSFFWAREYGAGVQNLINGEATPGKIQNLITTQCQLDELVTDQTVTVDPDYNIRVSIAIDGGSQGTLVFGLNTATNTKENRISKKQTQPMI